MDPALLLDPKEIRFQELNTAQDPLALPLGHMPLIKNTRWADKIVPQTRDPIAQFADGPPVASAEFRGRLDGQFQGKNYSAWYNPSSGKTEIWSMDSSGTWADVTPDSGKYGDCRFGSSAASDFYSFEIVPDPYSEEDVLLIADPQALVKPRTLAAASAGGALVMAIHEEITPPALALRMKIKYGPRVRLAVGGQSGSPSISSYSNSDATNWVGATSGSSPDSFTTLTRTAASAVANKTILINYGATANFGPCKEFQLVVDRGAYALWLQFLKIEIHDSGGNYSVVYDGPNGDYSAKVVPLDGVSTREVWAFPLDHISQNDRNQVDGIRFTWTSTELPPASVVLSLYAIWGSGGTPGGFEGIYAYGNSGSRAESPRCVVHEYVGAAFDEGSAAFSPYMDGLTMPFVPELLFVVTLFYQVPAQTERDKGVDTLYFYRKDSTPEGEPEDDFYLAKTVTFATYSGGWIWASASAEYEVVTETLVDGAPEEKDNRRIAPPSYHKVVPLGCQALRWASGRLFAAGGNTSEQYLWASQLESPFRHREKAIPGDETSPCRQRFAGETIYEIAAQSAGSTGSDAVFAVTDKKVRLIVGRGTSSILTPREICPFGSSAKRSVALYQGQLIFFDVESLQLRALRGGRIDNLTQGRVDNYYENARATAQLYCTKVKRDRIFFGCAAEGGSMGDSVLTYHLLTDRWESVDGEFPTGVTVRDFVDGFDPDTLLAFSLSGDVHKYDDPGAFASSPLDLGTTEIPIDFTWPFLRQKGFEGFVIRELEVLADQGTDVVLSTVRTTLSGATLPGTLTLSAASSGRILKFDTLGDAVGDCADIAIQPRIYGGSRARKKIYMVRTETDARFVRGS